jgi:hypothetical protein
MATLIPECSSSGGVVPTYYARKYIKQYSALLEYQDVHLLVSGPKGCGKLATILYLLQQVGMYNSHATTWKEYSTKYDSDTLTKFKHTSHGIYLLNCAQLTTNVEYVAYTNKIHDFCHSAKIKDTAAQRQTTKLVLILRNVHALPALYQRKLAYNIGSSSSATSVLFILLTSNLSRITSQIRSHIPTIVRVQAFSPIAFKNLCTKHLHIDIRNNELITQLYDIYIANQCNLQYTLCQYAASDASAASIAEELHPQANSTDELERRYPLLGTPVQYKLIMPLVTQYSKLTAITKLIGVRNYIISLLALNIDSNMIIRIALSGYLQLKSAPCHELIAIAAQSSQMLAKSGRHLPVLENFIYKCINAYFSPRIIQLKQCI